MRKVSLCILELSLEVVDLVLQGLYLFFSLFLLSVLFFLKLLKVIAVQISNLQLTLVGKPKHSNFNRLN